VRGCVVVAEVEAADGDPRLQTVSLQARKLVHGGRIIWVRWRNAKRDGVDRRERVVKVRVAGRVDLRWAHLVAARSRKFPVLVSWAPREEEKGSKGKATPRKKKGKGEEKGN
jgi:hypothetical protein